MREPVADGGNHGLATAYIVRTVVMNAGRKGMRTFPYSVKRVHLSIFRNAHGRRPTHTVLRAATSDVVLLPKKGRRATLSN